MFDEQFWKHWKAKYATPRSDENPTGMTMRLIRLELIEDMERDAIQRARHQADKAKNREYRSPPKVH